MTDVQVLFVHGVGGVRPDWSQSLLSGWEGRADADDGGNDGKDDRDAEAAVPTVLPRGPRLTVTTLEYTDVLDGFVEQEGVPGRRGSDDAGEAGPAGAALRVRELRYEAAIREVAAQCATRPGGTDGARRLRLPIPPGDLVVRMPLPGMGHALNYRSRPQVRRAAWARLADALELLDRPRVLVAHSLGSVVALDALRRHAVEVDLLLTIGSPVGADRLWASTWDRRAGLLPSELLGGWLNVVNTRDPVPWGRGVAERFPQAVDAFITAGVVRAGAGGVHDPGTYLGSPVVSQTLRALFGQPVRGATPADEAAADGGPADAAAEADVGVRRPSR